MAVMSSPQVMGLAASFRTTAAASSAETRLGFFSRVGFAAGGFSAGFAAFSLLRAGAAFRVPLALLVVLPFFVAMYVLLRVRGLASTRRGIHEHIRARRSERIKVFRPARAAFRAAACTAATWSSV